MKKLLSIVLAAFMLSAASVCFAASPSSPTASPKAACLSCATDVPVNHWAADAIEQGIKDGVINGFPDGTFRPDDPITREQWFAMLIRTMFPGKDVANDPIFDIAKAFYVAYERMKDFDPNSWSFPYCQLAYTTQAYDMTYGDSGIGNRMYYSPRGDMYRFEVSLGIFNFLHNHTSSYLYDYVDATIPPFKDVSRYEDLDLSIRYGEDYEKEIFINYDTYESTEHLHQAGILNGFPDGTFKYTKTLSRAEALKILQNPILKEVLVSAGMKAITF